VDRWVQNMETMGIVLYRRGRPTSIILLLLVVVSQLSLTLGRHPSLRLHHLFGLVRASRRNMSLVGVKVLQVGPGERACIAEVADRMVSWGATAHAWV
jgi:hypothetical protein